LPKRDFLGLTAPKQGRSDRKQSNLRKPAAGCERDLPVPCWQSTASHLYLWQGQGKRAQNPGMTQTGPGKASRSWRHPEDRCLQPQEGTSWRGPSLPARGTGARRNAGELAATTRPLGQPAGTKHGPVPPQPPSASLPTGPARPARAREGAAACPSTVPACTAGQHPRGATPTLALNTGSVPCAWQQNKTKQNEISPLPHPTARPGTFPCVYFCSHPGVVLWQNPPAHPSPQRQATAEPAESLLAGGRPRSPGRELGGSRQGLHVKSNRNIQCSNTEEGRVETANMGNSRSAGKTPGKQ